MQSWMAEALRKVNQGKSIHSIERTELMEAGLVVFADTPRELILTLLGNTKMSQAFNELENGKIS